MEAELQNGSFKSTDVAERLTLREAMQRYINEVLPTQKSRPSQITYANTIELHLGAYPLIALESEVIAGYRDKRLGMKVRSFRHFKDGHVEIKLLNRKVSTATVRHEISFIGRVIEHSRREWGVHLPAGNPVHLVKLPAMGKPRDRRLVMGEEEKLLTTLDANKAAERQRNPYMQALMIFALETSSRRSEIIRLQWNDVNLDSRTAILRNTKNGQNRDIGLSLRAVAALNAIPRSRDGRVFPVSSNAVRMAWRRALLRCEISGLKFHDLRHEATSRLAEKLGGNNVTLAAMTGHKSLQMLMRYTHLRGEDLARRLDAADSELEPAIVRAAFHEIRKS